MALVDVRMVLDLQSQVSSMNLDCLPWPLALFGKNLKPLIPNLIGREDVFFSTSGQYKRANSHRNDRKGWQKVVEGGSAQLCAAFVMKRTDIHNKCLFTVLIERASDILLLINNGHK